MEFTEEQKNYLADVYANGKSSSNVFREQHKADFIAGFEKALSLFAVSRQSEQFCPECKSLNVELDYGLGELYCHKCEKLVGQNCH